MLTILRPRSSEIISTPHKSLGILRPKPGEFVSSSLPAVAPRPTRSVPKLSDPKRMGRLVRRLLRDLEDRAWQREFPLDPVVDGNDMHWRVRIEAFDRDGRKIYLRMEETMAEILSATLLPAALANFDSRLTYSLLEPLREKFQALLKAHVEYAESRGLLLEGGASGDPKQLSQMP